MRHNFADCDPYLLDDDEDINFDLVCRNRKKKRCVILSHFIAAPGPLPFEPLRS